MIVPPPLTRQTLDLDAGWEYARVPAPPSVWNGPDAVPTAAWRVAAVSSQETAGEDARAAKAFDGKPATFWHTEWSLRRAPYPHSIAIDLGASTEVVGLRLLPRQTGPKNGRPGAFRLYLDGRLVKEGTVPDSTALYETRFPLAKGRFLRLEVLGGHRPEPFLALAEMGLIRPAKKAAAQDEAAEILSNGNRLDPSPPELEALRRAETRAIRGWSPATLPHAAWVRSLDTPDIWQGVAYYRRRLPAPLSGRRTVLALRGMQRVDLWLDGRWIGGRRGGYLPAQVPVTAGGDLLVRVDNSDNPLIPPGKPQGELDFMYGAGLVGNATLTITDPLHVTDALEVDRPHGGGVQVETRGIDAEGATLVVRAVVTNSDARLRHPIVVAIVRESSPPKMSVLGGRGKGEGGRAVLRGALVSGSVTLAPGETRAFVQTLRLPRPRLWSPDSPHLYRLRVEIREDGRVVDATETRFGVRTVAVSKARGFLLNGRPLRLVGTNRHEDYPWVGPALSDAANRRDALLIKRAGHNLVRLSHYDQSPAFLDACDELGVLTIPCIPGWQFTNGDPRFSQRVLRDVRELVRRDRNHPSVAWWEASLNETYPPAALAKRWYDEAHAEGARIVAGDASPGAPWDVVYNGWREDLSRPSDPVRPGYIREYGDYEFGGAASTSRVRLRDGVDRLLDEAWNHVWSTNRFRPQYPATMGMGTWEMFDHNVPWAFAVSASGLADLTRREKPSLWFFASQTAKKPYLRIARSLPLSGGGGQGEGGQVVVFTNAPTATLVLDGKPFQTRKAERGPATPYDLRRRFDGTNTADLAHPPIVFRDVPPARREIRVVGSNGATDVLRLPGKPARLKVWLDDLGASPTRNDLVFVRAAVVDAQGVACPLDARHVTFSGATFAGERTVAGEAGVASVLVRTPLKGRRIVVRASAPGLKGGGIRFGVR